MPLKVLGFLLTVVATATSHLNKESNESIVSRRHNDTGNDLYLIKDDATSNKSNHDEMFKINLYSETANVTTDRNLQDELEEETDEYDDVEFIIIENDEIKNETAKKIQKRSTRWNSMRGKNNHYANIKSISERKCHEYRDTISFIAKKSRRLGLHREVVGGKNTIIKKYPHMGALGWILKKGVLSFLCGSALISPNFIITAGHCIAKAVLKKHVKPSFVRLGTSRINVKKSKYDVGLRKIFKHPNYKSPKKYYDIALMLLDKKVIFNNLVQPACIWRTTEITSSKASLTGWGTINPKYDVQTDFLQECEVDFIDETKCAPLLKHNKYFSGLSTHQICAGNLSGGVDSCRGDSGGPLQVMVNSTHYIVGIVSFGNGCGVANSPGVYTRVSSFVNWIEEIVWKMDHGRN